MQRPKSYAAANDGFDLAKLDAAFEGSFDDGINACIECCDRHVGNGQPALNWIGKNGATRTLSFEELQEQAARFANLLTEHGIQPGDRVACLIPRIPELMIVMLGTMRAGAVYQPLFTAFGPKAIEQRIAGSGAKLIVTDGENRPKLDDVTDCPPVIACSDPRPGDVDFHTSMANQSTDFVPVLLRGDDLFLMLFTSGTTGSPKGFGVPLRVLRAFKVYMADGLDLRSEDRFWNIADPGWAYGLYYAVIGPLLMATRRRSRRPRSRSMRPVPSSGTMGSPTSRRLRPSIG